MAAFAKVIGRFMTWVIDGEDPDTNPDTVPLSGKISFTLNVSKTGEATASPDPVTWVTTTITGILDSSGYLCTAKADGTILYRGIWLPVTNDPGLNPTNLQYTVSYQLALGTQAAVIPPHLMALPSGSIIDLQAVIPPEAAPPASLAAAEAAAAAAQAIALSTENTVLSVYVDTDGHLKFTRDDGSVVDAGKVVGDVTPELIAARDSAVAAQVGAEAARDATLAMIPGAASTAVASAVTSQVNPIVQANSFLYVANTSISGNLSLSTVAQQSIIHYTLTGNCTLTALPSSPVTGMTVTLVLKQDATGSRTMTWGSTVKWAYGVAPVLSTTAAATDVIHLMWTGSLWVGAAAGLAYA